MQIIFDNLAPVFVKGARSAELSLEQAKDPEIKLDSSVEGEGSFTVLIRDTMEGEGGLGAYYHLLIVNADARLQGDVLLSYEEPRQPNHHYFHEVYRQLDWVELPKRNMSRHSSTTERWVGQIPALLIGSLEVITHHAGSLKDRYRAEPRELPEQAHDFMLPGHLTTGEEKYCRCLLHVGDSAHNPYAVCTKSTKNQVHSCSDYYNFEVMPLKELLVWSDRHGVYVANRNSRLSALQAVYRQKRSGANL